MSWVLDVGHKVCCVGPAGRSSSLGSFFCRSKSSSTPEELQEPVDDVEVEEVENPMHVAGQDGMRVVDGA